MRALFTATESKPNLSPILDVAPIRLSTLFTGAQSLYFLRSAIALGDLSSHSRSTSVPRLDERKRPKSQLLPVGRDNVVLLSGQLASLGQDIAEDSQDVQLRQNIS